MYLPREVNRWSLSAIASTSPPGSEIVFNYLDQLVFHKAEREPTSLFAMLLQAFASVGEPFPSGFDAATLQQSLAAEGLELVEEIDDVQVASRFDACGWCQWIQA